MSSLANASVGTIIKTQNKMLFFSLCILPCDNPRAVSRLLFFYQIRLYLSSLSINHKLLIIILLPIILNLLKFFQLFLC